MRAKNIVERLGEQRTELDQPEEAAFRDDQPQLDTDFSSKASAQKELAASEQGGKDAPQPRDEDNRQPAADELDAQPDATDRPEDTARAVAAETEEPAESDVVTDKKAAAETADDAGNDADAAQTPRARNHHGARPHLNESFQNRQEGQRARTASGRDQLVDDLVSGMFGKPTSERGSETVGPTVSDNAAAESQKATGNDAAAEPSGEIAAEAAGKATEDLADAGSEAAATSGKLAVESTVATMGSKKVDGTADTKAVTEVDEDLTAEDSSRSLPVEGDAEPDLALGDEEDGNGPDDPLDLESASPEAAEGDPDRYDVDVEPADDETDGTAAASGGNAVDIRQVDEILGGSPGGAQSADGATVGMKGVIDLGYDEAADFREEEEAEDPDEKAKRLEERLEYLSKADTIAYFREVALDESRASVLNAEQEVKYAQDIELGLVSETILEVAWAEMDGSLDELREDLTDSYYELLCDRRGANRDNFKEAVIDKIRSLAVEKADKHIKNAQTLRNKVYEDGDEQLTSATIYDLEYQVEQGRIAKTALNEHNFRLVFSIAMWPKTRAEAKANNIHPGDVLVEGLQGLAHAVEKFDYTKGYKFSTYSTPWIRQYMSRYIMDNSRDVRIPVHAQEFMNTYDKKAAELRNQSRLDIEPSEEEVARALEVDEKKIPNFINKVRQYRQDMQPIVSTDVIVGDAENTSFGDLIVETGGGDPSLEKIVEFSDLQRQIAHVLDSLEPREQFIIGSYFGLTTRNGDGMSTEQIGRELGITRQRVYQLINRILKKKLKDPSRADLLREYAHTDFSS